MNTKIGWKPLGTSVSNIHLLFLQTFSFLFSFAKDGDSHNL